MRVSGTRGEARGVDGRVRSGTERESSRTVLCSTEFDSCFLLGSLDGLVMVRDTF